MFVRNSIIMFESSNMAKNIEIQENLKKLQKNLKLYTMWTAVLSAQTDQIFGQKTVGIVCHNCKLTFNPSFWVMAMTSPNNHGFHKM